MRDKERQSAKRREREDYRQARGGLAETLTSKQALIQADGLTDKQAERQARGEIERDKQSSQIRQTSTEIEKE